MTPTRRTLLQALALLGLTVLAYAPGLTSPLTHYDDSLYVWNNLARLSPPGLEGLRLQWDSTSAWSGGFVEFFPLRDTVYWLIFQAFALNATPYHVASLLFHLAASLLLWRWLGQLGLSERSAYLGALLFALHPVHIESVVWVAGLKDPMYTMFMLLGLVAYASYRERPRPWTYALMLLGLVGGFLVKSLIVAMPVIMLAMELLIGRRVKPSLIAARLAGPFAITGLFMVQILLIGKANHVLTAPHHGSWLNHYVLMFWSQAKYLKQALFPTTFRLIYCFEPAQGWADWRLWVGVAVALAVVALAWRWRREPLRLFLMAVYVLALAPVSNLVPFPAIMADRYLYAATIGTCGLLALLTDRFRGRLYALTVTAVMLLLTAATASRAWVWQDEELLWEEPDTDPACLVDPSFPAAQSHVMRFVSSKDRGAALLSLERAMASPGFLRIEELLRCTTIVQAAAEAFNLGVEERAIHWARLANRHCPNDARGWNTTTVINLRRNPQVAAMAAQRTYRLRKHPETEVLMWLTRLSIADPDAPANLTRLAREQGQLVCWKILSWSADWPEHAPLLGEATHHCVQLRAGAPP